MKPQEMLVWLIGILIGLWVLWYFTGGPERTRQNQGLFINPVVPTTLDGNTGGEAYGPTDIAIDLSQTFNIQSETFVPPTTWKNVNTRHFIIVVPPGWIYTPTTIDETRGTFSKGTFTLSYSFGRYNSAYDEMPKDLYITNKEWVHGVRTFLIRPNRQTATLTGAFYKRYPWENKLTITGENLTTSQQQLAFAIFRTVQFK